MHHVAVSPRIYNTLFPRRSLKGLLDRRAEFENCTVYTTVKRTNERRRVDAIAMTSYVLSRA